MEGGRKMNRELKKHRIFSILVIPISSSTVSSKNKTNLAGADKENSLSFIFSQTTIRKIRKREKKPKVFLRSDNIIKGKKPSSQSRKTCKNVTIKSLEVWNAILKKSSTNEISTPKVLSSEKPH